MSLWQLVLTLFTVANPIGNIPLFITQVRGYDFKKQRYILFREALFSLFIALFFLYFGKDFFTLLHIKDFSIGISGGIVLFFVSIYMIFPPRISLQSAQIPQEPFFVPIATPLISGGAVLTTILVSSTQMPTTDVFLGIVLAWIPIIIIVTISVYLQKLLGNQGLIALERLMGMILCMLSVKIIISGIERFLQTTPL